MASVNCATNLLVEDLCNLLGLLISNSISVYTGLKLQLLDDLKNSGHTFSTIFLISSPTAVLHYLQRTAAAGKLSNSCLLESMLAGLNKMTFSRHSNSWGSFKVMLILLFCSFPGCLLTFFKYQRQDFPPPLPGICHTTGEGGIPNVSCNFTYFIVYIHSAPCLYPFSLLDSCPLDLSMMDKSTNLPNFWGFYLQQVQYLNHLQCNCKHVFREQMI